MRPWMKFWVTFIIASVVIYFGISFYNLYIDIKSQEVFQEEFDEENWNNPLRTMGIVDKLDIYKEDEQLKVDELYITVLKPKEKTDGINFTFNDIMIFTKENSNIKPKAEVFFQDGDKGLFDNGIFIRESNATIELRGKSSEKAPQKSFKITLFDREGLWHNQNIINLNKHYFDPLRIRNKLSFDYFKIIPNITSLRTRFVRLFIKDLSKENPDEVFSDYGFFTQVEHPNKIFLKNHGLDPNGHLYKAENFKFLRYAEAIKNKEDNNYSKRNFEEILEIRGSEKHEKLIEMLEVVNDYSNDINEVVDTYFDRENYLTWIAINILLDNYKSSNTNFLIYSPLNSNKWYFMPWDLDETWNFETDRPKWQKGLSMFWDNILHSRFFEDPKNVRELSKKIEELSIIINEKQTKEFLNKYYDIVLTNITKLPDLKYLPITLNDYMDQYEELAKIPERNKFYYYELLEDPMPFNLKTPYLKNNKYIFSWEKAYDVQGNEVSYKFELSRDEIFSNIVKSIEDIKNLSCEIDSLDEGIYYWRIIAKDSMGNSQIAHNIYRDEFADKHYGIMRLDTEEIQVLDEQTNERSEEISNIRNEDKKPETNTLHTSEDSKDEIIVIRDDTILITTESEIKDKFDKDKAIDSDDNLKINQVTDIGTKKEQTPKEVYRTYRLKAGETLYSVSMKFYGTKDKIDEIVELNNIKDIHDIPTGTVLKLPPK